jgi:mono/diheme cytochrome c family protein
MNYAYYFCLVSTALTVSPIAAEDTQLLASSAARILNRSCVECHGKNRQDGGLRLDSQAALLKGGDSGVVIEVDAVDQSELLRRISLSKGHSEVMPKRGDVLSSTDQKLLRNWIAAGAPWLNVEQVRKHWSYIAPKKTEFQTQLEGKGAIFNNPLDYFVARRLEAEGLSFSAAATPHVLARRLYLDIIGLPPTPEEVDEFVVAASQGLQRAVEDLVDRLLGLPQYGEKWATPWLDAARYADSHGFQRDDLHELWAYRDWVIQSLNADMPFNQFTIEQIAGDLLPNPTQSQLIATGFNRCAPCNVEAGTDPAENRYNQVVDRVNTLGYVWLGTTLECSQCHDHKYDPFTMRDYYGLFSFFNQTELEADRTNPNAPGSIKFLGPYLNLGSDSDEKLLSELNSKITTLNQQLKQALSSAGDSSAANQPKAAEAKKVLLPVEFNSTEGSSHEVLEDRSILVAGDPPEVDTYIATFELEPGELVGILLETLTDRSLPGMGPGRGDAKKPNFVLNSFEVNVNSFDSLSTAREKTVLKLTDARADFSQKSFDVAGAIDQDDKSAWAINPQFGKSHWAAFRFDDPQQLSGAKRLTVRMIQSYGGARTIGRFRISALYGDYQRALPTKITEPAGAKELKQQIAALEKHRDAISIPKTLVMRELTAPRESTMFMRGDFRAASEAVTPATPAVLHPLTDSESKNRLTLAQWLVSPENPLVGRVTVNRIWSEVFGIGLVSTPEDFGLKGELPSHPELLDWLAVDFVEQGWSQKKLLRTLLTSQTYRQSSKISPKARENDPSNRLLARGSRFRLPAEGIRDNALAIAGVLDLKQFGPPIRPPQPDGLWTKVGGEKYDYLVSPGTESLRRGVYVVLKRMSPYPSMINFDATPRLACRVKRGRSNTPLQALNLLNDPVYVDAARNLAARVTKERKDASLGSQLEYAFRLAVARSPSDKELDRLKALFEDELATQPSAPGAKPHEAAWFAIASTLLNLDETITKE